MYTLKLFLISFFILGILSVERKPEKNFDDLILGTMDCNFIVLCDKGLKKEYRDVFDTFDKKTVKYAVELMKKSFPKLMYDIEVKEVYSNAFWEHRAEELMCVRFNEEDRKRFSMELAEPMVKYFSKICQSLSLSAREECAKIEIAGVKIDPLVVQYCMVNTE